MVFTLKARLISFFLSVSQIEMLEIICLNVFFLLSLFPFNPQSLKAIFVSGKREKGGIL